MERAAKLQRIDDFRRRVPYESATASQSILKEAKIGIPEVVHQKAMREARDEKLKDTLRGYGVRI